jgi:hypothetical protein
VCVQSNRRKNDRYASWRAMNRLVWSGSDAASDLHALLFVLSKDSETLEDDDDLFFLLVELLARKKFLRLPPVIPRGYWDLDAYEQAELKFRFRFERANILALAEFIFGNLVFVKTDERDKCHVVEALCMYLRALSGTFRLRDLVEESHTSRERLSRIINHVAGMVFFCARSALFGLDEVYIKDNIEDWTVAVQKVAKDYETGIYAFIDGKLFFTTRLTWCKRVIFSGHKKRPGLKFQTVIAPNGLLINAYGPAPGRNHDSNVLTKSGILPTLRQLHAWGVLNQPANYDPSMPLRGISIYGDSAYPKRLGLFSAYKKFQLDAVPARKPIQDGLVEARSEIEHFYGNLILQWRGISNQLEMKNGLRPVGQYIMATLFFQNCFVCAEGSSQTSKKFGLKPPTLTQYLSYCVVRSARVVV